MPSAGGFGPPGSWFPSGNASSEAVKAKYKKGRRNSGHGEVV
jgi:hypothetical protein